MPADTPQGTAVSRSFTIQNSGTGELTLGELTLPSGFSLTSELPESLAVDGSTTLTIQLDATAGGSYSGSASLTNNDVDENPFVISLSGTVLEPELDATDGTGGPLTSGTTWDFGSTAQGTAVARSLTIQNSGTGELTLGLSLPSGFSLTSELPVSIPAGGTITLTIQLDAATGGDYSGTASLTTNDVDENPFDISLNGTVLEPELDATDGASEPLASGAAWDFGSTPRGTTVTRSLTLQNSGTGELTLGELTLPSGFTLTSELPDSIPVDGTTTLTIQLEATTGGTYSGSASLTSNDVDENPFVISLTGTVLDSEVNATDDAGEPLASGATWDFGSTPEGTTVTRSFTLQNSGTGELRLGALTLPSGFSLTSTLPATVAAGGSVTVTIQMSAAAGGSFSGLATLTTNDADENPFTLSLTGSVNPNQAPTASALQPVVIPESPESGAVDLWEYFSDAEDGPDLTYSVFSVADSDLFASTPTITDGFLTMKAAAGKAGESTQITIQATDSRGLSVTATLDVTVRVPEVWIVDRKHTGETASNGYFKLERDGDLTQTLTVTFELSGTATSGDDYTVTGATTGAVTFAADELTAEITIVPVNDSASEPHETVSISLSTGTAYAFGSDSPTTRAINLDDDDSGAVVFVSHVRNTVEVPTDEEDDDEGEEGEGDEEDSDESAVPGEIQIERIGTRPVYVTYGPPQ